MKKTEKIDPPRFVLANLTGRTRYNKSPLFRSPTRFANADLNGGTGAKQRCGDRYEIDPHNRLIFTKTGRKSKLPKYREVIED